MFHNGVEVNCVSVNEFVDNLIEWLQNQVGGNVILVGHNSKVFDAPRLLRHVSLCGKEMEFRQTVLGFSDTLAVFRSVYKEEIKGFSQTNLVKTILNKEYEQHNALADARALCDLVHSSKVTISDITGHSFTTDSVCTSNIRWRERCMNISSLQPLVGAGACSRVMLEKMASSGLQLRHLQLAHDETGDDGVAALLAKRDSRGRVRVTKSKKIVTSICAYLTNIRQTETT